MGNQCCAGWWQRIVDLCPRVAIAAPHTSLVEMVALISRAPLVLSNDSAGGHMGATFNVPTVIISNGQHMGRFHPYPRTVAGKTETVYPEGVSAHSTDYYYTSSPHVLAEISPERVMAAIHQVCAAH